MDENIYRKWDIHIKALALSGAVLSMLWGIYEYRESAQREFKKPFLEEQLKTCKEVTFLVAETVRIKNNKDRFLQLDELSVVYFSTSALFLSHGVLREFRVFIDLVDHCKDKKEINECHHQNMGRYQFNVAKACRNQLVKSWGQDIEHLKENIEKPMSW